MDRIISEPSVIVACSFLFIFFSSHTIPNQNFAKIVSSKSENFSFRYYFDTRDRATNKQILLESAGITVSDEDSCDYDFVHELQSNVQLLLYGMREDAMG